MSNSEVIFNTGDIIAVNGEMIYSLKEAAKNNQRKTMRICLHKNIEDSLHQMVIVHFKDSYIKPHKHPNKIESFHVIEGSFWVLIFDGTGKITDRFKLGERNSFDSVVCRIEKNIWHTVVPVTDIVVFHEITNGPFTGINDSVFPKWAPDPGDKEQVESFIKSLQI